jgi:central kinetochore subunit Mis15/CHL4
MTSTLVKSLSRLSRDALIDLALHWLDNPSTCAPYLASNRTSAEADDEDYLFPAAASITELRRIYNRLRDDEGDTTRSHIVDRIIDGDWRRGLTLYQHATIDFAYLSTHDTALRWQAVRVVPLEASTTTVSSEPPTKKRKTTHTQAAYPTISPTTFLATLKAQISPLVKAHYHLSTLPQPNLTTPLPILRIHIHPTHAFAPKRHTIPSSARHATDTGRTMYVALPPACPHIYISVSGTPTDSHPSKPTATKIDIAYLKRTILEAIPKALSRPHERWALQSTRLTVRSLAAMCALRGNETPGTAGGAFACLQPAARAEECPVAVCGRKRKGREDEAYPTPPPEDADDDEQARLRQREIELRFGPVALEGRARLDRVHVAIRDVMRPPDEARGLVDAAPLGVTFLGADVHAGLRRLAELGVLDLKCMPGWMAGEEGRSLISA